MQAFELLLCKKKRCFNSYCSGIGALTDTVRILILPLLYGKWCFNCAERSTLIIIVQDLLL